MFDYHDGIYTHIGVSHPLQKNTMRQNFATVSRIFWRFVELIQKPKYLYNLKCLQNIGLLCFASPKATQAQATALIWRRKHWKWCKRTQKCGTHRNRLGYWLTPLALLFSLFPWLMYAHWTDHSWAFPDQSKSRLRCGHRGLSQPCRTASKALLGGCSKRQLPMSTALIWRIHRDCDNSVLSSVLFVLLTYNFIVSSSSNRIIVCWWHNIVGPHQQQLQANLCFCVKPKAYLWWSNPKWPMLSLAFIHLHWCH